MAWQLKLSTVRLARVDYFLRSDNGMPLVNEINTMPLTDASGFRKCGKARQTFTMHDSISHAIERHSDRHETVPHVKAVCYVSLQKGGYYVSSKNIEIVSASGKSFEDAISTGIERASRDRQYQRSLDKGSKGRNKG